MKKLQIIAAVWIMTASLKRKGARRHPSGPVKKAGESLFLFSSSLTAFSGGHFLRFVHERRNLYEKTLSKTPRRYSVWSDLLICRSSRTDSLILIFSGQHLISVFTGDQE